MKLYEKLPSSIDYNNKTYELNTSYVAVLAVFDLLQDDEISPEIKIRTALDILIKGDHEISVDLLVLILNIFKTEKVSQKKDEPVMDIEQDWPFIISAFQQAYNIDLTADRQMHYLRFLALIKGIPKGTRLSEIMEIRARPIPAINDHNREQVSDLIRLKAEYAIKKNSMNFNDSVGFLFNSLKGKAVKKNGR